MTQVPEKLHPLEGAGLAFERVSFNFFYFHIFIR